MSLEASSSAAAAQGKRKKKENDNLTGYLFILPFLVGFFALTVFPVVMSLYLSFTNYDMLGTPSWIGFANYERMLMDDPKFVQSVKVTLFYVFTAVPFRLVFALAVALLLARLVVMKGMYRTLLYLPSVIGGSVAVSVMWRQLFGNEGALNSILAKLGLPTVSWLGDPAYAIWTLILLYGWQFGSSMLIFLAGLKNIPASYYEAAEVDGAGAWRRFVRITIPLLTPIILFNVVMQTIQGFMAFTPSYIIFEDGRPLNSTLVYVLYMFQRAFTFFDMGYASAMAWLLLLVIGLFTALIFKSSSYWVHYESEGER
ncbi:multiple sugar transport system permease protein [Paenibacillus phyllosphaerae]|uniref:Multiple sugar transport system permease protein n=1 Tax=Paenibacillus phyllosphaerae TaxID=274593 RepID=A0A7W5AZN9_9BACL|nr:sugar ABC transporter permease [Paenibacillus phyllosphaerae]MBB3111698.1 multiple sugar transport system permease protein [Paenibacillus phyllosphaerae]